MPELPEVESLRLSLLPFIQGQKVKKVMVQKPKLVSGRGNVRRSSPAKQKEFETALMGEKIIDIQRRAKNLIFLFTHGKIVLVHLKMTGQLVYRDHRPQKRLVFGGHPIDLSFVQVPNKHTHITFELEKGSLYYNDTRMFGFLLYFPDWRTLEKSGVFDAHGVDPLGSDFTLGFFRTGLKKKQARLKTVLMNQELVVGLGNIYCDEVCFAARVLPTRNTSSLKPEEIKKLHAAIKKILPQAIALNGTSTSDYLLADGSRGNYARELKVYGRAGEQCVRCRAVLKKTVINSRTTVYCGKCQN